MSSHDLKRAIEGVALLGDGAHIEQYMFGYVYSVIVVCCANTNRPFRVYKFEGSNFLTAQNPTWESRTQAQGFASRLWAAQFDIS